MSWRLEAAHAVAARIASDAIWHRGRCSWVGPTLEVRPGTREPAPVVVGAALGPELYAGTAGVGLALAEIAAATGDSRIRRAGVGALRHATTRADDIPSTAATGLFTGRLGIGLAAVRAGLILGDQGLVEAGDGLVTALRGTRAPSGRQDLIGGRAGALLGALAMGGALERPDLEAWATDLGDELIAAAEIGGGGLSWAHPTIPARGNLTGLSHGAAGIAHALTELHAATEARRFAEAAGRAIAYEQGLFDPATSNWPDLRDAGPDRGALLARSRVFWCHGSAGIALARHRAWLLGQGDARRAEALAGVMTTARWVRAALRTSRGSFCLCHGLAGNCEALWDCAASAGEGAADLRTLVLDVAGEGVEQHVRRRRPWPCGTRGLESPGLMLGLAGIARFYLRLHDPLTPSLLLPGRGVVEVRTSAARPPRATTAGPPPR